MREIKFRGYDPDLKKWHYGNYYFYTDTIYCVASDKDHEENEHHCILFDGFCDWDMPRPHYKAIIDKNSIGQYTGLKDKDGVEIYEGDIVNVVHGNGYETFEESVEVEYDNKLCGFSPMDWKYDCDGCSIYCEILEIEVIGNIYENPELMEEK